MATARVGGVKVRGSDTNYYRHFIGDYLRKTVHLTMLQDGAYRRLMDEYYVSEKPLTLDRKLLYARVRANTVEERWAVDSMLAEFFIETAKGHTNKKAEEELEFANSRAKASRKNGLTGGRPVTKQQPTRFRESARVETCEKAPQTPDSRLQTEEKPKFIPPTQAEVCAYMHSREIPEADRQAELFVAHHANRKWRLGGGTGPVMMNWKQAVITWQGNIGKYSRGSNGTRQPSTTGAGATRAEQRITEAQRQSERVLGRTSGLVGSLRADLPGRPDRGVACFLPGNSEAVVIETGNPAPSVADRGATVARVPAKTRTDLRDSGDVDGAGAAGRQPAKVPG